MVSQNSYDFVLDCSVTMAWCFEDEGDQFSNAVLESMSEAKVIVPSIWPLEVANVLLLAQRKDRLSAFAASSFIDALSALAIMVDRSTTDRAMHSISVIAQKAHLTIYDAAYLELALREKIPLATLDRELVKAAKFLDVPLINPL